MKMKYVVLLLTFLSANLAYGAGKCPNVVSSEGAWKLPAGWTLQSQYGDKKPGSPNNVIYTIMDRRAPIFCNYCINDLCANHFYIYKNITIKPIIGTGWKKLENVTYCKAKITESSKCLWE